MQKIIYNWSGGKDSSFALWKLLENKDFYPEYLLTTLSYEHKRISMHGVPEKLLDDQASSLGFQLRKIYLKEDTSHDTYNQLMQDEMSFATSKGIDKAAFGDIFLEDLKEYRDSQLEKVGMTGVYPIWGYNTKELVKEFIDSGFKAIIVSCNARLLDESFCGRIIDHDFINDLPENVDPCGENGEFHSFVFDGPIFSKSIEFEKGETVLKEYNTEGHIDSKFWYCDLLEK